MMKGKMAEQPSRKKPDLTAWTRIASVLFIGAAILMYVKQDVPQFAPLPMKSLEVDPDLTSIRSLNAKAGALRGRSVIVVTLDTTRPDRLGCYGDPDISDIDTPTIDRLAREGILFSNAVATAPATLPSHASIFTGLYPPNHGARSNGLEPLAEDQQTLAEAFSSHGYDTAAFVSAFVLAERYGLAQGFTHYDDQLGEASTVGGYTERSANETTDRAIAWIKQARSRPFFLWVHYFDPHQGHNPPEPFASQHAHPYDGEIASMDHELGRLLETVDAATRSEPLIVVTADHGEGLGEHGEWSHGFLAYESTLQIPLIMHAPNTIGRGQHFAQRVSQVDLMPTIGALFDLELQNPLDGVDLLQPQDPNRVVFAEAVYGQTSFGWAVLSVLYRGSLKYIHGPDPELYDLDRDPLEDKNINRVRPRVVLELARELERLPGALELLHSTQDEADIDPAEAARLEALGYVMPTVRQIDRKQSGPDPKEMLPLMTEVGRIVASVGADESEPLWKNWLGRILGQRRSLGQAIGELEEIAARHPGFAPVHQYLGLLYKRDGREDDYQRARARLKEAIASPGRRTAE